jgi:hypothetical protein
VFHFTEQLHLQYNILHKVLNGGLTKTMTNVHVQRQNGITEFFTVGMSAAQWAAPSSSSSSVGPGG